MSILTSWTTITRIQEVLNEFKERISREYPEATYAVEVGGEPDGVYLVVTIDLEDTEDVLNVVMDRMLQVQIEERLPVYVLPLRPTGSTFEPANRWQQPATTATSSV